MARNPRTHYAQWEEDFIYLSYPTFDTNLIAQILNKTQRSIQSKASLLNCKKACSVSSGDIFGKLTVLDEFEWVGPKNNRRRKWKCHCGCGNTTWVNQIGLVTGNTKSCGCLAKELKYKGTKYVPGWFYSNLKRSAKNRHLELTVTIEDIEELLIKQNFKCALTNLPLKLGCEDSKKSMSECTASIDRIDSTKGYTKNNIQILHVDINIMKGMYDQDYFVQICHLISQNNEFKPDDDLLLGNKKIRIGKKEYYRYNEIAMRYRKRKKEMNQ